MKIKEGSNTTRAENSKIIQLALDRGLLDTFRYGSSAMFALISKVRGRKEEFEFDEGEKFLINSDFGTFGHYFNEHVPLDFPDLEEDQSNAWKYDPELASGAKFKGKEVPLNSPMKGDVKLFKVFVKDPKTGNVKKINFGLNTNRKLLEDPMRRKAFSDRHSCPTANDKLTPKYWSCRTNRFFHKIYGGKPIGGRFW